MVAAGRQVDHPHGFIARRGVDRVDQCVDDRVGDCVTSVWSIQTDAQDRALVVDHEAGWDRRIRLHALSIICCPSCDRFHVIAFMGVLLDEPFGQRVQRFLTGRGTARCVGQTHRAAFT